MEVKRLIFFAFLFIFLAVLPTAFAAKTATSTAASKGTFLTIKVRVEDVVKELNYEIRKIETALQNSQDMDVETYTRLLKQLKELQRELAEIRAKNAKIKALKNEISIAEEMLKERNFRIALGVISSTTADYLPVVELDWKLYRLHSLALGFGANLAADFTEGWDIDTVAMKSEILLDFYLLEFLTGVEASYFPEDDFWNFGLLLGIGVNRGAISVAAEYDFSTQRAMATVGYCF